MEHKHRLLMDLMVEGYLLHSKATDQDKATAHDLGPQVVQHTSMGYSLTQVAKRTIAEFGVTRFRATIAVATANPIDASMMFAVVLRAEHKNAATRALNVVSFLYPSVPMRATIRDVSGVIKCDIWKTKSMGKATLFAIEDILFRAGMSFACGCSVNGPCPVRPRHFEQYNRKTEWPHVASAKTEPCPSKLNGSNCIHSNPEHEQSHTNGSETWGDGDADMVEKMMVYNFPDRVTSIEPGLYRHQRSGGLYTVIGMATHHEKRLPMVKYVSHTYGGENVRPLYGWPGDPDGWLDMVEPDGTLAKAPSETMMLRFKFVGELPSDTKISER